MAKRIAPGSPELAALIIVVSHSRAMLITQAEVPQIPLAVAGRSNGQIV